MKSFRQPHYDYLLKCDETTKQIFLELIMIRLMIKTWPVKEEKNSQSLISNRRINSDHTPKI